MASVSVAFGSSFRRTHCCTAAMAGAPTPVAARKMTPCRGVEHAVDDDTVEVQLSIESGAEAVDEGDRAEPGRVARTRAVAFSGPARALHACPFVERGGSSVAARGAGRYWPLGLGRGAEVRSLRTPRRRGIANCRSPRQCPVTRKFHGGSDRQVLAVSAVIEDLGPPELSGK